MAGCLLSGYSPASPDCGGRAKGCRKPLIVGSLAGREGVGLPRNCAWFFGRVGLPWSEMRVSRFGLDLGPIWLRWRRGALGAAGSILGESHLRLPVDLDCSSQALARPQGSECESSIWRQPCNFSRGGTRAADSLIENKSAQVLTASDSREEGGGV